MVGRWGRPAIGALAVPVLALVMGAGGDPRARAPLGLDSGHGIALDAARRDAARALARAIAALEQGDLSEAGSALDAAKAAEPIGDHLGLQRARWLLARDRADDAAEHAAATRAAFPGTPIAAQLMRLEGDAWAADGDERKARATWQVALEQTNDAAARREIRLAIIESRQRSGELDASAAPESLLASEFGESVLPGELSPGRRSPELALRAADELVAAGRGADAVEAYREAIAGGLPPERLRHARLEEGKALFRLRRYPEALPSFELLGRDREGRFWRARTLARLGRIEQALVGFEALAGGQDDEWAAHAAYLAGTLLEDRGKHARAMAHYNRVAADPTQNERALAALWRIGWSAWMRGDAIEARARFQEMSERAGERGEGLRARYWAARSAERSGDVATARTELSAIAQDWPLSYYGWRAAERIGDLSSGPAPAARSVAEDPRATKDRPTLERAPLERIALLLEAGLDGAARDELVQIGAQARTRADHVVVGQLLVASGDYYQAQRLVLGGYGEPLARGPRVGDEPLLFLSWPPAYRELVEQSAAGLTGVEPALVWAIMREESSFRPAVMSSAGAIGLLQLMPETARRQARRSGLSPIAHDEQLTEPGTNIELGSAYLEYLAERFPDRLSATIGSYNAGPNAVARWLRGEASEWDDDVWVEDIPYGQTRAYVKRVLRSLYVYQRYY